MITLPKALVDKFNNEYHRDNDQYGGDYRDPVASGDELDGVP